MSGGLTTLPTLSRWSKNRLYHAPAGNFVQHDQKKKTKTNSYLSLSSLIRSNFFSTSCSGSSSSSLKVFYKTTRDFNTKLRIKWNEKGNHRFDSQHTSWVPTHSASDTTRRRSFVLGPLRAFSASTKDDSTSSRCSLYFLSEITLFYKGKKNNNT